MVLPAVGERGLAVGFDRQELKSRKRTACLRSDSPGPLIHWWVSRKPWTNSNDRSPQFICQEIQQLAWICVFDSHAALCAKTQPTAEFFITLGLSPQACSFQAGSESTQSALFFGLFPLICHPVYNALGFARRHLRSLRIGTPKAGEGHSLLIQPCNPGMLLLMERNLFNGTHSALSSSLSTRSPSPSLSLSTLVRRAIPEALVRVGSLHSHPVFYFLTLSSRLKANGYGPQHKAASHPRNKINGPSTPHPMFSSRTNWPLTPNRFTQTLNELRSSGASLLDLTASNPTQCGFHYDSAGILSAFQNLTALVYDPQPKGTLAARCEVVRYYLDDHHVTVDPESLLLTTSTSEAYSYVFRLLCNPGEELLLPKPSYPLFEFLAGLQDVHLVPYSLEYAQGWFIDFRSLESAITPHTRAILLVHPNNPTGSYVSPEELARLNALCRQRNLALIVDEVFLDFAFVGSARKTFAANSEVLTFTLSGLSKISALPQMKIAWLAVTGPDSLVRSALDRLEIIADTYLSLSASVQAVLPTLLAQRNSLRKQLLDRIGLNHAYLESLLRANPLAELLHAEGGWYAVLHLRRTSASDEDLAVHLLRDHHVLLHPGHFYDFPSNGFLVLSLITPTADFRQGLTHLLAALRSIHASPSQI